MFSITSVLAICLRLWYVFTGAKEYMLVKTDNCRHKSLILTPAKLNRFQDNLSPDRQGFTPQFSYSISLHKAAD